MQCKNCLHECHCGNNGVCVTCKCANCEHNALDEFWERLEENAGIIMNLSKHRD
jgi:hypothetical protein